ncbi:VWA domain-containing protein [Enterovirga sp.]|uniref:vWA domain-containing protein n=1 Tax=Enterovirga sp. TaxID=2026350 RepID=UPI002BC176CF|nr:VWA domain-containing protein [Enterovirga sp.]HMO27716.1 VWA domain-containing protein [Enterovirga sp.]
MAQTTPSDGAGEGGARRVLDVVFVVDCSGSMTGERIGALNWAAKTVVPTMRAHAEDHPDVALRLRVLRFATGAAFTAPRPEPVEHFAWTNLVASGESDMGAAFRLLARAFAAQEEAGETLPPVVVLFSDGYPSDDAAGGLEALLATGPGRRAVRVPIAIGQDADMALLRSFSSDPALPPLRSPDVEMLVGRMQWVAGGPVAAALSQGAPSHTTHGKPDEDEDLW